MCIVMRDVYLMIYLIIGTVGSRQHESRRYYSTRAQRDARPVYRISGIYTHYVWILNGIVRITVGYESSTSHVTL